MMLWVICKNVHSFAWGSCAFLSFLQPEFSLYLMTCNLKMVIMHVTWLKIKFLMARLAMCQLATKFLSKPFLH